MNKSYFIAPVVALLLFGGIYGTFRSGHKAREAARQEQVRIEKETKLQAEVAARRQAIDEALVTQAQRKKEREAKETRDKLEKETRQSAIDERDRIFREQDKSARDIQRVKKEIAAEQESLAKIAEARKASVTEQAFLRDFVAKAEANARNLEAVLNQFASAEAARVAAAAAKAASLK